MKIPVIADLYNEVNRLYIAGARFATNDPRLVKIIPMLEKMGQKSAPIQKLAELTANLVKSAEPEKALDELGVLLYAILNTQSETCPSLPIDNGTEVFFDKMPKSILPYSTLAPIINALTNKGPNRLEIIKNAHEQQQTKDFRLYGHIVRGLGDKYAEIPNYLTKTVIPSLGSVMIPFLLKDYENTIGKAKEFRLSLLEKLEYSEWRNL